MLIERAAIDMLLPSFERLVPAGREAAGILARDTRVAASAVQANLDRVEALAITRRIAAAPGKLVPVQTAKRLEGTTLKLLLEDLATKQRYLFKPLDASSTAFEAEAFALGLRHAAGEPAGRVIPYSLEHEGKRISGYVKPLIENKGALKGAPATWTEAQQANLLGDHPWTWLTGDIDAHANQYVKLGERGYPLNTDRDHALKGYQKAVALTRFNVHNPNMPTAVEVLYREYTSGRLELNFDVLRQQARVIQSLPDEVIERELRPFLDKAFANGQKFGAFEKPEQLLAAVQQRKSGMVAEMEAFVKRLQEERLLNHGIGLESRPLGQRLDGAIKDTQSGTASFLYDTPVRGWGERVTQWATKLSNLFKGPVPARS